MEKAFEAFLSSQMCDGSVKSYLSYTRNAFKKFSGEKNSIFDFLKQYTQNSRELYCEHLISLLNKPFFSFFKNLYNGCAFSPFTSIFWNILNVTP